MFQNVEDLLTVEEACDLLRIGRGAMYALLANGRVKAFRNGRVWRIPKDSLVQYICQSSGLAN